MHESDDMSKSAEDRANRNVGGRPKSPDEPRSECLSVTMTTQLLKTLEATAKRWSMPTSTLAFNILDYACSRRVLTPGEARAFARGAAIRSNFFVPAETKTDRSAS